MNEKEKDKGLNASYLLLCPKKVNEILLIATKIRRLRKSYMPYMT